MIHGENSPPSKYELSLKGKFEIWDEGESGSLERRKKKKWVSLIGNSLIYFIIIQKRKTGMLVFVQTSPVAQVVKDSPEVQETPVRFLGREKCPGEGGGLPTSISLSFPGGSVSKESPCNTGNLGFIPWLGRPPRGGQGNPLQYSCLENPHGQRNPAGCSPRGGKQSDTTGWLSTAQSLFNQ